MIEPTTTHPTSTGSIRSGIRSKKYVWGSHIRQPVVRAISSWISLRLVTTATAIAKPSSEPTSPIARP